MAILGNFETTMIQKQSMAIIVNYKDKHDTTTTTANNSMGFDLSAIQSCGTILLKKYCVYQTNLKCIYMVYIAPG